MPQTWIDVASTYLTNAFNVGGAAEAGESFSPQQQAILQKAFQQCFVAFAKEIGIIIAAKLAELRNELLNDKYSSNGANRDRVAALSFDFGAAHGTLTTLKKRRIRRIRNANERCYPRDILLQYIDVADTPGDGLDCTFLHQRVSALERYVTISSYAAVCSSCDTQLGPMLSGVPAATLAQQCRGAVVIQQIWCWHRARRIVQYISMATHMDEHVVAPILGSESSHDPLDAFLDDITWSHAVSLDVLPSDILQDGVSYANNFDDQRGSFA